MWVDDLRRAPDGGRVAIGVAGAVDGVLSVGLDGLLRRRRQRRRRHPLLLLLLRRRRGWLRLRPMLLLLMPLLALILQYPPDS